MNHGISLQESYWPADNSEPILNMTAGQALERAAELAPDKTALVELVPEGMESLIGAAATDRRWNYAQLLQASRKMAQWLLTQFEPGDHICLWAPNVPEWVILQYASAFAGLVLVTANPALRERELNYVVTNSKSSALFFTREFRGTDMAAIANSLNVPNLRLFDLAELRDERLPDLDDNTAFPEVKPEDPAQIQYTSGTTGEPKGALLRHFALVTNASFIAKRGGLNQGVLVSPMPLFHTAGSVMSVLGCVSTCSTLVLPVLFEPNSILDKLETEKADVIYGVPTMIIALVEAAKGRATVYQGLKYMVSGGAPVPSELMRRTQDVFGCKVLAVYGQTELSPIICQTSHDDGLDEQINTAGKPLWQVEVRIANPDNQAVLPIGQEGEIQARGYQSMLGYYGLPEATSNTINTDGWLRTGDVGRMDARGYITVTARLKDMIIRGGENIYPAEVEACILERPDVMDVAVLGVADEKWGETVAAVIQIRPDQTPPTVEELRAHCRKHMAPQKTPEHWFLCDTFPLTGSGKVQKFRLRQMVKEQKLTKL